MRLSRAIFWSACLFALFRDPHLNPDQGKGRIFAIAAATRQLGPVG